MASPPLFSSVSPVVAGIDPGVLDAQREPNVMPARMRQPDLRFTEPPVRPPNTLFMGMPTRAA